MSDEFSQQREILSPREIELKRVDGIGLSLRVRGGQAHEGVRVYNPLPLEGGLRYVCFADRKDKELAMVRIDETLGDDARAIIEEALARRYMRALVVRVANIEVEGRTSYWDVETDRGRREFVLANPVDNIQRPSETHMVITDVHENRFEIPDVSALDANSQRLLDLVL